jgi:hypothetical protein
MTDTTLARALDLTRAVTDILSKGGAIGGLIGHVMKWLAREGIPEGEFAYCLEKSKALIYPNDNGLKIRSRLRESDAKLKAKPYVAGLRLVNALSIGRWMADDPDYCYLVTTVAALFTNHDMAYASVAICDMLLEKGNHEEGTSKVYRYEKSRLLPVVKKVVESITLNVVNTSGNFDNLPEEIRGTCSHQIDAHTFAAAAMAISRVPGDVIIRCNRFLADLYVWLLAHIEGELSLSIAGKIIHRATFGRPLRSVTMLADEACSEEQDEIASALVISINVDGALRTMLRHTAGYARLGGSCLNIRQPLYDLVGYNHAGRVNKALTAQESREIYIAGQSIVRWLMTRPAVAAGNTRIVYRTDLEDTSVQSGGLTVDTLLSRWPTICNEDFGSGTLGSSSEDPIILNPIFYDRQETMSIRDVFDCFSHTRAIIEHACRRCRCLSCWTEVSGTVQNHGILSKPGCLAYLAEDHLCLIIAHAVADGFDIPDASNLRDSSVIRHGVQKLMSELLSGVQIAWRTWFSLAACTYLGCSWVETTFAGEDATELAAIQHGSEVVVAPWVDLRRELASEGSFSCLIANGRLCEMETDFGVLYAEQTSPPADTSRGRKSPESQSMTAGISEIFLQTTITVVYEPLFRLTTIAKAGDYLRIVNPAPVMMALSSTRMPKCIESFHGVPAQDHQMWSVEDALGLWDEDTLRSDLWIVVDATTRYIAKKKRSCQTEPSHGAISERLCVETRRLLPYMCNSTSGQPRQ